MTRRTLFGPVLLALPALFLLSQSAFGNCNQDVNLKLSSSKIHITNGLKCIYVGDPSSINTTMTVKLPNSNVYALGNGQVVVSKTTVDPTAQFPVKATTDPNMACDPGIDFAGTNVGNNDMSVSITGQVTSTGIGCYDVLVQGLGKLDPRAKIVEDNLSLGRGAELAEVLGAIEVLKNSDYGPFFEMYPVDDFIQDAYGLTMEEAQADIDAYHRSLSKYE